jgi:dihydrofolate synthase/folylpolyglutamate synthase
MSQKISSLEAPKADTGLADWLSRLEDLHPTSIDLGLDRVSQVWQRLALDFDGIPIITIGGTNGKGSSQAMLEAIYLAQGYSTGVYSSPHLLRYNERIRLNGQPATDADICNAFAAIEAVRGDISLTYFEFGTLAAFWLFARACPQVLILEVGLGGRLDAVNILDADVALITSIDYDHEDWLGKDIDQIAREKAGILRPGRIGVFNGSRPPQGLLDAAQAIGARLWLQGRDYGYECEAGGQGWHWWQGVKRLEHLPAPALSGVHQYANAAAALAVIEALQDRLPVTPVAMAQGLQALKLPGRFQIIQDSPQVILDVAHNPEAARSLAATLSRQPCQGRTLAIFGIMADKDAKAVVAELIPLVDLWLPAAPGLPRAMPVSEVAALLKREGAQAIEPAPSLAHAYARARALAGPLDRILVFGSFFVLGEILELL